MCFGLSDTPKLRSAIAAVVRKYPDITLACFERDSYDVLHDVISANVVLVRSCKNAMEKYNVIGALVGVDYQGNTYGLKEMRV